MTDLALIMGSSSDWETMKFTAEILEDFGVSFEKKLSQLIVVLN